MCIGFGCVMEAFERLAPNFHETVVCRPADESVTGEVSLARPPPRPDEAAISFEPKRENRTKIHTSTSSRCPSR